MPRIFFGGGRIISDDVFTIEDDDFDVGAPLQIIETAEADFDEDDFIDSQTPSPEEMMPLEATRREVEQMLQKAHDDAVTILNKAAIQAQIDRDHLMQQTAAELEQIKNQAYAEAYERGLVEGAQTQVMTLRDTMSKVQLTIGEMEGERAGFIAEYEYNLKWLAWEIASKILGKKLEEDETEMISLVRMAVASVKNAQWITVEVSENMTTLIDSLTREFKRIDERVEVRGITAPHGTCIIDTPDGLIDASIYRQLENLRIYFANED